YAKLASEKPSSILHLQYSHHGAMIGSVGFRNYPMLLYAHRRNGAIEHIVDCPDGCYDRNCPRAIRPNARTPEAFVQPINGITSRYVVEVAPYNYGAVVFCKRFD